MNPSISILLPTYKPQNLTQALNSLWSQTFTNFEVLLITNGTSKETHEQIKKLKDPRLRHLHLPQPNLVRALNLGLQHATGEFIARMDDDDISHPQRLAQQRDHLKKHPATDIVSCQVKIPRAARENEGLQRYIRWQNSLITDADMKLQRFVESPLTHPTLFMRRERLIRAGGYREGPFPEDYELWLRLMENGAVFHKLPVPLLTWCDSLQRLTRTDDRYATAAFYRIKTPYLARWLRKNLDPERSLDVWGAGRTGLRRSDLLCELGYVIKGYVDIDPKKIGGLRRGRFVIAPCDIPFLDSPFILSYVSSQGGRESIQEALEGFGLRAGGDYLMVA